MGAVAEVSEARQKVRFCFVKNVSFENKKQMHHLLVKNSDLFEDKSKDVGQGSFYFWQGWSAVLNNVLASSSSSRSEKRPSPPPPRHAVV